MEMKRLRFVIEMFSGMQKILVDLMSPPKWVNKREREFAEKNDCVLI
jgi:hypothetical protein